MGEWLSFIASRLCPCKNVCAVSVTLQVLYKLKTAKLFDANKCRTSDVSEHLFAVNMMSFCVESRLLCIAGTEYVLLFKFSKQENMVDCPVCWNVVQYSTVDR